MSQTSYVRDVLGRVTKVVDCNGNAVRYQWGLTDEKKSVAYPGGFKVEYSYDTRGRLTGVLAGEDRTE